MEQLEIILLVLTLAGVAYLVFKNYTPRVQRTDGKAIMLDSSALIDGRILEVARAGFLSGSLIVPSSVLREMQYLADNSDHDKRSRARHGLDIVHELQELKNTSVQILNDGLPGSGGVDERLIQLSKTHSADLLTLDFNLNKVAQVEGVNVLNINALAQSLRLSYLPGERRSLQLVQKGQDGSQAVGYLEDGTMVVVEQAADSIGTAIEVEFTRALQTQAGKMLFAKKVSAKKRSQSNSRKPTHSKSNTKKSPVVVPEAVVEASTPKNDQVIIAGDNKENTPQKVKQSFNKHRNTQRRKRSPEDSLVELANKQ